MQELSDTLKNIIQSNVAAALAEDIGTGDITGMLIPEKTLGKAKIITREDGVLCGRAWVEETFHAVSSEIIIKWHFQDGSTIAADDCLAEISGPTRAILTAERTALNFLQTLSGTASVSREFATVVKGKNVKLLDTRKTIPGLRGAQKYAVLCGGCQNHRMGLFDAFLIKENHLAVSGDIKSAVLAARKISSSTPIEVEVENLDQLIKALEMNCERVMLDNFDIFSLRKAVQLAKGKKTTLEASGNVSKSNLLEIADTGVDYISIGALTKNSRALDLSLLLI